MSSWTVRTWGSWVTAVLITNQPAIEAVAVCGPEDLPGFGYSKNLQRVPKRNSGSPHSVFIHVSCATWHRVGRVRTRDDPKYLIVRIFHKILIPLIYYNMAGCFSQKSQVSQILWFLHFFPGSLAAFPVFSHFRDFPHLFLWSVNKVWQCTQILKRGGIMIPVLVSHCNLMFDGPCQQW